jgi:hypothetical protein
MQSECSSDISVDCGHVGLRCHVCDGSRLRRLFSVPLLDGPHEYNKDVKRRPIYQSNSCCHLATSLYDPLRYANYYASLSDDYHCCHEYDQSRYKQILGSLPNQ